MTNRDSEYTLSQWPGSTQAYMDLDWLIPNKRINPEDITLPPGYAINPDETEENSIAGPQKDKILELFEELNTPPLTEETVESFRESRRFGIIGGN